jgi:hypothetical protein
VIYVRDERMNKEDNSKWLKYLHKWISEHHNPSESPDSKHTKSLYTEEELNDIYVAENSVISTLGKWIDHYATFGTKSTYGPCNKETIDSLILQGLFVALEHAMPYHEIFRVHTINKKSPEIPEIEEEKKG